MAGHSETHAFVATSSDLRHWRFSRAQDSLAGARLTAFTEWRGQWWASGTTEGANGLAVWSSRDGASWRIHRLGSMTSTGVGLSDIAVTSSRIVTVGYTHPDPNEPFGQVEIWSSSDGDEWERAGTDFVGALYAVAAADDGRFVAVGENEIEYGPIFTSPDGRTWTRIGFERDGPLGLQWVIHSPAGMTLAGKHNQLFRSFDGQTWRDVGAEFDGDVAGWDEVTWAGDRFVAFEGYHNIEGCCVWSFGSSDDGDAWSEHGVDAVRDDAVFRLEWTDLISRRSIDTR